MAVATTTLEVFGFRLGGSNAFAIAATPLHRRCRWWSPLVGQRKSSRVCRRYLCDVAQLAWQTTKYERVWYVCVRVRDQLFCSCVYGLRLCFVVDLTVVVLKCDTQRVSVKAGSCERRGRGACERVHAATVVFAAAWHLHDIG